MKIEVRVQPRSSKNSILKMEDGSLKVKLRAAPVDGEANRELIAYLSSQLKVPKRDIAIVSGDTARNKVISIAGLEPEEFLQRLKLRP